MMAHIVREILLDFAGISIMGANLFSHGNYEAVLRYS
ncbi:hypothetical protein Psfp_00544 [Pelotomaculum sp. FP]|nr:hypothetical protein Psfp_00544 [Pelotomaculum sp. FP]